MYIRVASNRMSDLDPLITMVCGQDMLHSLGPCQGSRIPVGWRGFASSGRELSKGRFFDASNTTFDRVGTKGGLTTVHVYRVDTSKRDSNEYVVMPLACKGRRGVEHTNSHGDW